MIYYYLELIVDHAIIMVEPNIKSISSADCKKVESDIFGEIESFTVFKITIK